MKLCSDKQDGCYPICDSCKHYEFNGDEKGRYTGNGYCNKHQEQMSPERYCDDFHCSKAD
jgi:heat shock protein HslJ